MYRDFALKGASLFSVAMTPCRFESRTSDLMRCCKIQTNVRPCVAKKPVCRKIGQISEFTTRCINRNSVINLLLTLNTTTFCCGWFYEDIVEKNPRSLRSYWSFSAHQFFRHARTDVSNHSGAGTAHLRASGGKEKKLGHEAAAPSGLSPFHLYINSASGFLFLPAACPISFIPSWA